MTERRQHDRRHQPARRHQDRIEVLGERPRILVVEPHDDTRLLYSLLLEEAGYLVSSAKDGPAGIALAQQTLPDVLVTELVVPAADGFDILRQLRETPLTADIPVIVVTASVHFDLWSRARASGAMLVLAKPTTVDDILSALDDVMTSTPRERLLRRRLARALLVIRAYGKQCASIADAEDRIRAFIDRLQVAVLAIDEQGRCVAASRGATTMTGFSRTALLEMSVHDATLGPALPLAEAWRQAQSRDDSTVDVLIQDALGKTINVQITFESISSSMHAAALVAG